MQLAIYHNLPSGGAKRTLGEAVRRLAANHEIDVYTMSSANHDFADVRPFVRRHEVYPFQPLRLFESPFGRLNQISRTASLQRLQHLTPTIAKDIERSDYDAIFVEPCQYETAPSLLAHLTHENTVYYCHEPIRRLYEPAPWRPYESSSRLRTMADRVDPLPSIFQSTLKRADLRNTKRASTVLVNSTYNEAAVRGIYDVDARVCYHGVDVEQFAPVGVEGEDFVLTVGSLTPLKGIDFLIASLACIPNDRRPPLVVASNFQNPPERQYLEELAATVEVELRLMGNISDAFLVELYNRAAVTVYAPIREPFGLVAIESMACGTPVVAVREGGIPETVVNGYTGILVDRDEEAFADALQRLLADAKMRREYGANGRTHTVENWTWDRAVANLEGFLAPDV